MDESPSKRLLKYFDSEHLLPELRPFARVFFDTALFLENTLPDGAEKTVAIRKLLESKDAAVRAALELVKKINAL